MCLKLCNIRNRAHWNFHLIWRPHTLVSLVIIGVKVVNLQSLKQPVCVFDKVSVTPSALDVPGARFTCTNSSDTHNPAPWNCLHTWKPALLVSLVNYLAFEDVGRALQIKKNLGFNQERTCQWSLFVSISFLLSFLWSLGDARCSGRRQCELDVHELIKYSRPCPVELSSYFESSFLCVPGINLQFFHRIFFFCFISKLCRWGMLWNAFLSNWSSWTVQTLHALPIGTVIISGDQFHLHFWFVNLRSPKIPQF